MGAMGISPIVVSIGHFTWCKCVKGGRKLGLFRFPRSAGESVPSRTSVFRQAVADEGGTLARGFFMRPALAGG